MPSKTSYSLITNFYNTIKCIDNNLKQQETTIKSLTKILLIYLNQKFLKILKKLKFKLKKKMIL